MRKNWTNKYSYKLLLNWIRSIRMDWKNSTWPHQRQSDVVKYRTFSFFRSARQALRELFWTKPKTSINHSQLLEMLSLPSLMGRWVWSGWKAEGFPFVVLLFSTQFLLRCLRQSQNPVSAVAPSVRYIKILLLSPFSLIDGTKSSLASLSKMHYMWHKKCSVICTLTDPRALPRLQTDPHPARESGRQRTHHHRHLCVPSLLQWVGNKVHSWLWKEVNGPKKNLCSCSNIHFL